MLVPGSTTYYVQLTKERHHVSVYPHLKSMFMLALHMSELILL